MSYMATPQHKNTCSEDNEIHNYGRPFYHYYTLGLSAQCPRIFKKYINFTIFTQKLSTHRGNQIYNFLSPYSTDAKY